MTPAARIAREDALTDALRAASEAIGDEPPTEQALRIIQTLKNLRGDRPARVASLERVDYLERVQITAQRAWMSEHGDRTGPEFTATAGIDTPIGRLTATTWRRQWATGRIAWASEYSLDGEPITIAEIRDAGLAQRPTERRKRR